MNKEDFKNIKFENLERVYLGGTGRMYRFILNNNSYLYKPAEQKNTHKKQLFRGYVQECASKIQNIIDKASYVPCIFINNDNLYGSVQLEIPNNGFKYGRVEDSLDYEFTDNEINQFLREMVTDYLLCNFDSHGSNFIVCNDGIIRGIDKEQSFRYIARTDLDFFDINCNPNDEYGERELIYHYIFRRYINEKFNINFDILDTYIKNVESISNEDYILIFKDYIESRKEKIDKSYLENLIISRKINLRKELNNFIIYLENERHMIR